MNCEHRAWIFTILQHPPFYREMTKQLLKKIETKTSELGHINEIQFLESLGLSKHIVLKTLRQLTDACEPSRCLHRTGRFSCVRYHSRRIARLVECFHPCIWRCLFACIFVCLCDDCWRASVTSWSSSTLIGASLDLRRCTQFRRRSPWGSSTSESLLSMRLFTTPFFHSFRPARQDSTRTVSQGSKGWRSRAPLL